MRNTLCCREKDGKLCEIDDKSNTTKEMKLKNINPNNKAEKKRKSYGRKQGHNYAGKLSKF